MRIESPDGAFLGLSSFNGPLKLILPVYLPQDSFSHDGALIHLTFISDSPLIKDDLSLSMWFLLKLATVGISLGDNEIPSPLHFSIFPIPYVILLSLLVLDPLQIVSIAHIIIVYHRTTVTWFSFELLEIVLRLTDCIRLSQWLVRIYLT